MSLHSNNKAEWEAGFRLETFEVWNWGTFDEQVWKLMPGGMTSLLTGANASGKTTLVDGLLTLLVPEKRMRFYNQTAGSKGERTEDSYVLGEYGEIENTKTQLREVQKLRPDKARAQSILLAVFRKGIQSVSLVQARWYSGGEMKRSFLLAHTALSITEDFMPFDNQGAWRKRLKEKYPKTGSREVLTLSNSPGVYGRLMRRVFGMRSEKAHTLFSQTIGLKVLGNLDVFVREQMLEKRNSEGEFQKIKDFFKTLNDAHNAIEKAYLQIEMLRPIRTEAGKLEALKENLNQQEYSLNVLPIWYSVRSQAFLEVHWETLKRELHLLTEKLEGIQQEIEYLRNEETNLNIQIQSDDVGRQIGSLQADNSRLENRKANRKRTLDRYNQSASNIQFQTNPRSSALFEEQRQRAQKSLDDTKKQLLEFEERGYQIRKQKEKLEKEQNQLSNELLTLQSQKNNITGNPARIRQEILQHTGATESEIPFIGELIRVNDEHKAWESAIERLLHSFALRLLVPEEYYASVNTYVNQTNLRGRIIYHRFKQGNFNRKSLHEFDKRHLIHKLSFKPSVFQAWIRNEIESRYDFLCVQNLADLRLARKAITQSGLIKSGTRHEKDDRKGVKNQRNYVLGWDNKEKIAVLREELGQLSQQILPLQEEMVRLEKHRKNLEDRRQNLDSLFFFQSFEEIDWWSLARKIQENERSIQELERTNDRVKTLKEQRDMVLGQIQQKEKTRDEINRKLYGVEDKEAQTAKRIGEIRSQMNSWSEIEDLEAKISAFEEAFLLGKEMKLSTIDSIRRTIFETLNKDIQGIKDDIRKAEGAAANFMRKFKQPNQDIQNRFPDWNTDTHLLPEEVEAIGAYVQLLDRIEKQELADYKQQFKKYLNEEMITKMSDFQTWLEEQEEDIEESIRNLNHSLEKINFKNNPPTFIQLAVEKDYSPKVREFRQMLKDWKPNLADFERTKDDRILENSFNRIKELLDGLTEDENRRKQVLDVRNWLKFKAIEHHKEDPSQVFRSYTGTAKLSGGEGAQLTYTILGSAIAYQFGIHNEGLNSSFRFICVDEAFSKQDDEKAQFLMKLCEQLNLQVMVVSPAKAEELAIVEPYISNVHFVQRKNNRNSVVYDMPIKKLHEQRKEYLETH